ncbi:hypothetical protein Q8A67_020942 [Cirrhinus molitorella]|uniref:Uncharacterized protein n=1 Tax=Cirrhinus molitorella TaxID=172907 RepID=A0AA88THE1_9TELE|nr:hypothetical protein Q8A67_020942 [Cirrhinus molitorella]
MGPVLQLNWPGRSLEPVGLAQGGLATDPSGDGTESGTSRNTSPGLEHSTHNPPPSSSLIPALPSRTRQGILLSDQRRHILHLSLESTSSSIHQHVSSPSAWQQPRPDQASGNALALRDVHENFEEKKQKKREGFGMRQHAYLLPCREGPEGTMGVSHECDEPSPDNRPARALCSPEPHWLRVASTTNTFTFF